jgi:hypothetical protein
VLDHGVEPEEDLFAVDDVELEQRRGATHTSFGARVLDQS